LEVQGGEPEIDVNRSYSTHTQLFVAFSAGRVYEGSSSHYRKSTSVTATPRCLAITRYSHGWD
jgi:hypothetical protein